MTDFIQPESGAVTRTDEAKLREMAISIEDFGAVADGSDQSTAINTALSVAIAERRSLYIPSNDYYASAISGTLSAGALTCGLTIFGNGPGSRLCKFGTSSDRLLSLTHADADIGNPGEAGITLRNFSLIGNEKLVNAPCLHIKDAADLVIDSVACQLGSVGLDLEGSLIATIRDCDFQRGVVGVRLRKSVSPLGSVAANAVSLYGNRIKSNSSLGVDLVDGSSFRIFDNDLENNGSKDDLTTGAIMIRATAGAETTFCTVTMGGNHFELNKGRAFQAETPNGYVIITSVGDIFLGTEGGRCFYTAGGGTYVDIIGALAGTPGDTFTLNAVRRTVSGGLIGSIAGTAMYSAISNLQGPGTEGDRHSPLWMGGGAGIKQTWANGAGGYTLAPNTNTGDYEIGPMGGGESGVIRIGGSINMAPGKVIKVAGNQVVGPQAPALPANATTLASALTLINAMKATMIAHGLTKKR